MEARRRAIDPQLVYLDAFLIDRARLSRGLAVKQLAFDADVAYRTVRGIYERDGLLPSKARDIAQVLNQDVLDLLAPWDPRYKPPAELPGPWSGASEWETESYLDQGRLAPNGLYFLVCRMRHRHTAGRIGRGKFYHLAWMPPKIRAERRHHLTRHADVCARVGVHPQIVVNLTSTPSAGDDGWWVVDDWTGEQTLADSLRYGVWSPERLPRLLLDVAQGLSALHAAEIAFRELAPARVLIADKGGRAVLTDFELAKLLDGGPSVSSEWPEDPFRAPEVDGGVTTVRSDLYSFGQLVAAALTGPEFDPSRSAAAVKTAGLPKRLQSLVLGCLEPVPDRRPADLTRLMSELQRWAEQ
jgi:serine/threonine protein kinase